MMKKLCLILISIFAIFSLTSCMRPKEKVIGDFIYILEEKTQLYYSVVGLSEEGKTKKELVIPSEINGIPITRIGYSINYSNDSKYSFASENLEILYFSEILEIMSDKLFLNCPKLKKIICLSKTDINSNRDMVIQINYIGVVSQYKIINDEKQYIYGYTFTDSYVVDWPKYFYVPANVVYFLNENEDIYYIDFCENITMDNLPKDPKRVGYKFLGWYKEKECVNKWDITTDKIPAIEERGISLSYEITKLYPKWESVY